jgi:uncharacterized protein YkwD
VGGAAPAAGASCANVHMVPSSSNLAQARHATLCLINAERRRRHLRRLRASASLGWAARGHATDMVRRDYFSHTTPAGLTAADRIGRTSYGSRGRRVRTGENIAWGSRAFASPLQTVRRWMRSAAHRRNILSRRYRHVGVGIALGSPGLGSGGATYVAAFGG